MTDLPPDAAGAAPDFDAIRQDAATGTPGREPDPGSPGTAPAPEPVSLVPVPRTRRLPRPAAKPDGAARATASERASAMAARFAGGWPFGRILGVGVLIVALFALLAIGVGGSALADLTSARNHVVNTLDPAAFRASQLEVELLNQETGVRGYALSAQLAFLRPYYEGLAGQRQQVARLRQLLHGVPGATAQLDTVLQRAGTWQSTYAQYTINRVRASGKPVTGAPAGLGKAEFDRIRTALGRLQANLVTQRQYAAGTLHNSAQVLNATLIAIAVVLLLTVLVLALGLWRSAIHPLNRLAADARPVPPDA